MAINTDLISYNNNSVMLKMADKLYNKLTQNRKNTLSAQFQTIIAEGCKPMSSKDAGGMIGRAVVQAKTESVINACRKVFGGAAETLALAPAVKLAVDVAAVTAGSIIIPAALLISNAAYSKILGKKPVAEKIAKPPKVELSQLIHRSKEDKIVSLNGSVLSERDVERIRKGILKYNLLSRLINGSREDVQALYNETIIQRSDGKLLAQDGTELRDKDKKALKDGLDMLREDDNSTFRKKEIKNFIKKIREFGQFPILHAYDKLIVKGNDGIYCTREDEVIEGQKKGYILTQDEVDFVISVSDKQAEFVNKYLTSIFDFKEDFSSATIKKNGLIISGEELKTILSVAQVLKLCHPTDFPVEFGKFKDLLKSFDWALVD